MLDFDINMLCMRAVVVCIVLYWSQCLALESECLGVCPRSSLDAENFCRKGAILLQLHSARSSLQSLGVYPEIANTSLQSLGVYPEIANVSVQSVGDPPQTTNTSLQSLGGLPEILNTSLQSVGTSPEIATTFSSSAGDNQTSGSLLMRPDEAFHKDNLVSKVSKVKSQKKAGKSQAWSLQAAIVPLMEKKAAPTAASVVLVMFIVICCMGTVLAGVLSLDTETFQEDTTQTKTLWPVRSDHGDIVTREVGFIADSHSLKA